MEDVLATGPGISAIAPAAFAAVVAAARFAVSTLNPAHARMVLVLGSVAPAARRSSPVPRRCPSPWPGSSSPLPGPPHCSRRC